MATRLLVAYGMIAAIAAGALLALWIFVLREKWARRGRRIRFHRDRADSARSSPTRAREALEAD